MAHEFVYSQPVKIYFGEGKFAKLGEVLEELGVERCVIACGKHFAPTAKEMQEKDSRIVAVFGGVEQNPQLSGVIETTRLARETKADAVIGIGGGSAILPRPSPWATAKPLNTITGRSPSRQSV